MNNLPEKNGGKLWEHDFPLMNEWLENYNNLSLTQNFFEGTF